MNKILLTTLATLALSTSARAQQLQADFSSTAATKAIYTQGFDSPEDFATWTLDQTAEKTWYVGNNVPNVNFNEYDPSNQNSLILTYGKDQNEKLTSPPIQIPPGSSVEYYNYFSPVWLVYGAYKFYATDVATGDTVLLLDQFRWAQEQAYDETRWKRFRFPLNRLAGKTVTFTFHYVGSDGENEVIDGFRVVSIDNSDMATVTINQGDSISFVDLSTGGATAWHWNLPGAVVDKSTEQNPTATYNTVGTYDVSLTVNDGAGATSTKTRKGYVVVQGTQPQAKIGLPETGYLSPFAAIFIPVGTQVQYHDLSKGFPTAWRWQFKGVDPEIWTEQNPIVTYNTAGRYSLSLKASNQYGFTNDVLLNAIKVGGDEFVWNIKPEESPKLQKIELGFYGNYAGSNWLGIKAFAEHYDRPLAKATIDSVYVYFISAKVISPEANITLRILKADEQGRPGEELARTSIKAKEIKYSDETFLPTRFILPQTVTVDTEFFVSIEDFPNYASEQEPYDTDDLALACLRRPLGQKNTAWQLVEDQDERGMPLGTYQWFENSEDPVSMAICPVVNFSENSSVMPVVVPATQATNTEIYDLYGRKLNTVPADRIYIRDGRLHVPK